MRRGEVAERRQLDDRFDAIFEEHRQHDHVLRHGFEKSRANRRGALRNFVDQHAAFLRRALTD